MWIFWILRMHELFKKKVQEKFKKSLIKCVRFAHSVGAFINCIKKSSFIEMEKIRTLNWQHEILQITIPYRFIPQVVLWPVVFWPSFHSIITKWWYPIAFFSHADQITQWDHPRLTNIMSSMLELNKIRFSAYRTANKLRYIQKRLHRKWSASLAVFIQNTFFLVSSGIVPFSCFITDWSASLAVFIQDTFFLVSSGIVPFFMLHYWFFSNFQLMSSFLTWFFYSS